MKNFLKINEKKFNIYYFIFLIYWVKEHYETVIICRSTCDYDAFCATFSKKVVKKKWIPASTGMT